MFQDIKEAGAVKNVILKWERLPPLHEVQFHTIGHKMPVFRDDLLVHINTDSVLDTAGIDKGADHTAVICAIVDMLFNRQRSERFPQEAVPVWPEWVVFTDLCLQLPLPSRLHTSLLLPGSEYLLRL